VSFVKRCVGRDLKTSVELGLARQEHFASTARCRSNDASRLPSITGSARFIFLASAPRRARSSRQRRERALQIETVTQFGFRYALIANLLVIVNRR